MEEQISSELFILGYTGSGHQDQDTMNKCIDFLTVLFKDAPAVIQQREILSRQETCHQLVKDFMVASRAKVGGFIPGLKNENLMDALIKNQFPASLQTRYLDGLGDESIRCISEIQRDSHQFNEKIKPLVTRMNEDSALSISPFQRQRIDSDQWELSWDAIRQALREELSIKQYISLTKEEEAALDALLKTPMAFNGKYFEDLALNGADLVTLLKMETFCDDDKKKALLDWYIREGKDTPADKFTILAVIQRIGQRNASVRSVLDAHESAIDLFMTNQRKDWLNNLSSPSGFRYNSIPVYLSYDKVFMLAAVEQDNRALAYASYALKGDREIVLAAVKQNALALQYASVALRGDREIVLAAVKQNGWALQYASVALKGDREIVLAAVKEDASVLQFASESLNNNKAFLLDAVEQNLGVIQYFHQAMLEDEAFMSLIRNRQPGFIDEIPGEYLKNKPR